MNIELLSPAKDMYCGIEAVNHGADAVYIGAANYSARMAAGNTIQDIEILTKYAHQYNAKVYVAINTVLSDSELLDVEILINNLYNTGIDAIIIQDLGILELNLPPVALHASTQIDNRSLDKIKLLESAGFSRVILARELSLFEIKTISDNTAVELEAFVHGSVCVSYSGRCYMSQASCNRSANKGNCAQYCRLPYDLLDSEGKILIKNKHLLSLKDMDRSDYLKDMINAGISSFKIEGRLKDVEYVKNITAFYRQKLDNIIENNPSISPSSLGKCTFFFTPDPAKTFNRDKTDYFLNDKKDSIGLLHTSKSVGENIGSITQVGRNYFYLNNDIELNNGDGICFFDEEGTKGFYVNKVYDGKIFPSEMHNLKAGMVLHRNYNHAFIQSLRKKSAERKINVKILFQETADGFRLTISNYNNNYASMNFSHNKDLASKPEIVEDNIIAQLSKLGNTAFSANDVIVNIDKPWFIPSSTLAAWRKEVTTLLASVQMESFVKDKIHAKTKPIKPNMYFKNKDISYRENITNQKAIDFYKKHGAKNFQLEFQANNAVLMQCKYCIKYALGWCNNNAIETLFLKYKDKKYRLEFDCAACNMLVFSENAPL